MDEIISQGKAQKTWIGWQPVCGVYPLTCNVWKYLFKKNPKQTNKKKRALQRSFGEQWSDLMS